MRVAVLGQGSIGRRHAGNLLELGHEVVAWDPVAEVLEGVVARRVTGGGARRRGRRRSSRARRATMRRQALLALEHGCHVLVEKPLALTAPRRTPSLALAAERGLVLGVAMNLRFHPAVLAVREAVASGAIGRPLGRARLVRIVAAGLASGNGLPQSYSARRELGGGVLLDAIHEIDYLTWILGPVASVVARRSRTVSDLEIDVEDVAQIQLEVRLRRRGRAVARLPRPVVRPRVPDRRHATGPSRGRGPTAGSRCDRPALARRRTAVPRDVVGTYPAEMRAFVEAAGSGGMAVYHRR